MGDFLKLRKFFCFSHAPALSCAPAPRHSPALAAPARKRRPMGAMTTIFRSKSRAPAKWRATFCVFIERYFVFWAPRPSLSFPPRSPKRHDGSLPARKRRSMRPGAHAFLPRLLPYAGAPAFLFPKSRAPAPVARGFFAASASPLCYNLKKE